MSASGRSFTLNGINYGGTTYEVYVCEYFDSIPGVKLNVAELANANGVVTQGNKHGALVFKMRCKLVGTTNATRKTKWAAFKTQWMAAHAAGLTTFAPDWTTDTWMARPYTQGGVDAQVAITGNEFELQVIAPDPTPI